MTTARAPTVRDLDRFDPGGTDVEALERAYRRALADADPGALPVVGYGEISLVFAWPPDRPTVAVKSLPVFADPGRLAAYVALIDEYTATLRARGTPVVPSTVRRAAAPGGWRGYLLQPLLPAESIGPAVLRRRGDDAPGLLGAIVDRLFATIDHRVGLDAQVSNWAVVDGHPWYLDVGTPMLRDVRGRDRLDVDILVTAVPWLLRSVVARRVAPSILRPYHDPRATVLDTAGNLLRERLPGWIGPLLEITNPRLEQPLTEAEVHRFYRSNARLYASLQALRRADQVWQRRVRRRPYPLLLPRHYER